MSNAPVEGIKLSKQGLEGVIRWLLLKMDSLLHLDGINLGSLGPVHYEKAILDPKLHFKRIPLM